MLTEKQYEVLRSYQSSSIPVSQNIDKMTAYLFEREFIEPKTFEYTVHEECDVTYQKSVWALTLHGKLVMDEFEERHAQIFENRVWQAILVVIGLLTLAVTILK